jgi:hypothetical protein
MVHGGKFRRASKPEPGTPLPPLSQDQGVTVFLKKFRLDIEDLLVRREGSVIMEVVLVHGAAGPLKPRGKIKKYVNSEDAFF